MLTEAGEGMFQNCLEMLATVDDYVTERRNIETGPFGTLRVLAESDYAQHVLAPLATKFGRSRPGLGVPAESDCAQNGLARAATKFGSARLGLRVHVSAVWSHGVAVEDGFDVIVS